MSEYSLELPQLLLNINKNASFGDVDWRIFNPPASLLHRLNGCYLYLKAILINMLTTYPVLTYTLKLMDLQGMSLSSFSFSTVVRYMMFTLSLTPSSHPQFHHSIPACL